MVKRLGCASTDCECHVIGGTGVHVDGAGSEDSPFVVSTGSYYGVLKGAVTPSVSVQVTGVGTSAAPYAVRAQVTAPGLTSANTARFVRSGNWVKPRNSIVMVLVTVVGAGGGGGSGAGRQGDPASVPGRGGGGGGWSQSLFHSSWLPDVVPVTVGLGGVGGVGQVDQLFGSPGANGGESRFGSFLVAGGGLGGVFNPNIVNELPGRSVGVESGGTTLRKANQAGRSTFKAGGGGGSGGDLESSGATYLPGGDVYSYVTTPGQVPPTPYVPPRPGIPAPAGAAAGGGGGQGGWGYVDGHTLAQAGQVGGYPGGGGGGGGEADSGRLPGSGGRGADGWVEIVTWSALGGQWDTTVPSLAWDAVAPTVTWDTWK